MNSQVFQSGADLLWGLKADSILTVLGLTPLHRTRFLLYLRVFKQASHDFFTGNFLVQAQEKKENGTHEDKTGVIVFKNSSGCYIEVKISKNIYSSKNI